VEATTGKMQAVVLNDALMKAGRRHRRRLGPRLERQQSGTREETPAKP
jgi:hypothetical protein